MIPNGTTVSGRPRSETVRQVEAVPVEAPKEPPVWWTPLLVSVAWCAGPAVIVLSMGIAASMLLAVFGTLKLVRELVSGL